MGFFLRQKATKSRKDQHAQSWKRWVGIALLVRYDTPQDVVACYTQCEFLTPIHMAFVLRAQTTNYVHGHHSCFTLTCASASDPFFLINQEKIKIKKKEWNSKPWVSLNLGLGWTNHTYIDLKQHIQISFCLCFVVFIAKMTFWCFNSYNP